MDIGGVTVSYVESCLSPEGRRKPLHLDSFLDLPEGDTYDLAFVDTLEEKGTAMLNAGHHRNKFASVIRHFVKINPKYEVYISTHHLFDRGVNHGSS